MAEDRESDKKKKPFVIRQLNYEIRQAEKDLKQAKEDKVNSEIDRLEEVLKDLKQRLKKVTSDDPDKRQEARREERREYYNDLGGAWVAALVKENDELRDLFEEAVRKGWKPDVFLDELYRTKWWKDPEKSGSWKDAFRLENQADKTPWEDALKAAKLEIQDLAQNLYNMDIPADVLDRIARKYMYEGWDKNDGRGLRVWLAERFGRQEDKGAELTPGGMLLDQERTLRDAARAYGTYRDDDWISKTSRDILNPNSNYSEDDAWNELIAEAESLYPVFAGKLSKDRSVRDLGAGYISQLARYLEINDPNMIDLTDPLLQKAFTNVNDKGEATALPLWQFTQDIKKDARWQYTTNALDTYSSIGSDLARMMGFVR